MIVDCALYERGVRRPGLLDVSEAPRSFGDRESFVWLGMYEPSPEEFDEVRRHFDLHELAVEDALSAHQRPKLEIYDESVFMVVKSARYLDATETIEFGEIVVFIGDGFIVHVRHGEATPLKDVRQRLERRPDLVACGPSAVLYAIVDQVVDSYEAVLDGLDNDIREVELSVFSEESNDDAAERIYFLKREVLELRDSLAPLQKPLYDLSARRHPLRRGRHPGVLPRRRRPPDPHGRSREPLRRPAGQRAVGQPHSGRRAAERGHAEDLGLGRDPGRPDRARGHLRHELRQHARAALALGLPLGAPVHGRVCVGLHRAFKRTGWL